MKPSMIAILIALVAVAAGGGYWVWNQYFTDVAMAYRAFNGNGSVTCTYVDAETGNEGTMYVRDGDMRAVGPVEGGFMEADTGGGETTEAHMLMRGDTMYMWADGEDQGIEFTPGETDDSGFNFDQEEVAFAKHENKEELESQFEDYQAECSRGADAEWFELPEEVEFINPAALFEQSMSESMEASGSDFEDMEESNAEMEAEMDEMLEQMEQME